MVRAGLVLAAVFAAFGLLAGPALAVEPPTATQPYNTATSSDFWNAVNNPAGDPADPRGFPTSDAAKTRAGLWRLRSAARLVPSMRAMGTLGILTTTTVLEWKFAHSTWNPGGFIYRRLTGDTYGATTGVNYRWKCLGSTGSCPFGGLSVGTLSLTSGWYLQGFAGTPSPDYTYPGGGTAGDYAHSVSGSELSTGAGTFVKARTDVQQDRAWSMQPSTAADYAAAATANKVDTGTYTVPADVGNAADIAAARATLDADPDRDTRDYVNRILDPTYGGGFTLTGPDCVGMLSAVACTSALSTLGHTGTETVNVATTATANPAYPANAVITQSWTPGATITTTGALTITVNPGAAAMPFTFPAPLYGETADDYRTRLITAGLLGTITITTLTDATAVPQLGRSATVRVRVGTTTLTVPVPTTSPFPASGTAVSPWTSPSPAPRADTDVEIEANPDTLPDYGGVPGSGASDCPCPIPGVDFSPLAEISTGSTFPFGVFNFFGDVLDHFNVTPVPPGWDFSLGTDAVGHYEYDWDLSAFSSYMAIVRSLISVALWIGAVWLLATRLLGFHAGGDVTEAADDGSVI